MKLEVWPGMVHVFQIRGLPESREAIDHIGEFVRSHLPGALAKTSTSGRVSNQNPKQLSVASIAYERIPLGEADDYKPCIARTPDGELLLTAFHQYKRAGNKVMEQTRLFRSRDGGKTWSPPEQLDLLGREPCCLLQYSVVFRASSWH